MEKPRTGTVVTTHVGGIDPLVVKRTLSRTTFLSLNCSWVCLTVSGSLSFSSNSFVVSVVAFAILGSSSLPRLVMGPTELLLHRLDS